MSCYFNQFSKEGIGRQMPVTKSIAPRCSKCKSKVLCADIVLTGDGSVLFAGRCLGCDEWVESITHLSTMESIKRDLSNRSDRPMPVRPPLKGGAVLKLTPKDEEYLRSMNGAFTNDSQKK